MLKAKMMGQKTKVVFTYKGKPIWEVTMDRAVDEKDKDAMSQIDSIKQFLAATNRIEAEEINHELILV